MAGTKSTLEMQSAPRANILTNDYTHETYEETTYLPELCANKHCAQPKRHYSADRANPRYRRKNTSCSRRYRPLKIHSPFEDDTLQYQHLNFKSLKEEHMPSFPMLNSSLQHAKRFFNYLKYTPLGTTYDKLLAQLHPTTKENISTQSTKAISSQKLKLHNSPANFKLPSLQYQADKADLSSESSKSSKSSYQKRTRTASPLNRPKSPNNIKGLNLLASDQAAYRGSPSPNTIKRPVSISVSGSKGRTPNIDCSQMQRATGSVQGRRDWGTSGETMAVWVDNSEFEGKNKKKQRKFVDTVLDR